MFIHFSVVSPVGYFLDFAFVVGHVAGQSSKKLSHVASKRE
jgi:hypothetical protein